MNNKQLFKCPFCEGNTKKGRKTLYVYPLTNSYWCARCGMSGSLSEIDLKIDIMPIEYKSITPINNWNNEGQRFSICKKRNYANDIDTFEIKSISGIQKGLYKRYQNN